MIYPAGLARTLSLKTRIITICKQFEELRSLKTLMSLLRQIPMPAQSCSKKYSTSILCNICPTASICPCNYVLVFKFVPCTGGFDPHDDGNLRDIESDNSAPPNSIISASWCKRPDLRAPNQQTANLKVCCATPESANHFHKERIRVHGELVNVRMDLRVSTRCNRCQEYSHIRANCINLE